MIRSRVTSVKFNIRGMYESLECGACGLFEESQSHILDCSQQNKIKMNQEIRYKIVFNGTVHDQLKVERVFKDNVDTLEEMRTKQEEYCEYFPNGTI